MSKSEISIESACKNALQVFENNNITTIYLAYSGGVDSSVLVHSFNQVLSKGRAKNKAKRHIKAIAIHANHGLQSLADSWQQHCELNCQLLGLEIHSKKLQLDTEQLRINGIEATAREARYKWFFEFIDSDHAALMTAHHQGDQAETVLLNLIRGSGVAGLAGIRKQAERDSVMLMRPFLAVPENTILRYARQHQLEWVEDRSNNNTEFLRNRVRHDLLPLMENVRVGASINLARLAINMRDVEGLLEELAIEDLTGSVDCVPNPLDGSYHLPVNKVDKLSEPRVVNIIRHWLKLVGFQSPARSVLLELAGWCRGEGKEKLTYQLSDGSFYGYRGTLYYVPDGEQDWLETGQWIELSKPWLMRGGRHLRMRTQPISDLESQSFEVVNLSRQDKCTRNDGSTRSLAKLMQDHRIPIWRRSNLWGVKCNSDIIWVAGVDNLLSADDFRLEYVP